jgi:hypothetical protein
MRYSKISPESWIVLKSEIRSGNTPAKAINEEIEFVKEHGLEYVTLDYGGFTMSIDAESDIKQLLGDFCHWRDLQD